MRRVYALVSYFALLSFVPALVQSAVSVPWQTKRYYGFDGPWQAVSVSIGGFMNGTVPERQWIAMDLLPGGNFPNYVIAQQYCSRQSLSGQCQPPHTWDPGSNQTQSGQPIFFTPNEDYRGLNGMYMTGRIYAQLIGIPGATCPNASSVAVTAGNFTLPDKSAHPLELGFLSLGADGGAEYQQFTTSDTDATSPPIKANILPGWMFGQNLVKSYSYGLHIGSTGNGFTGSLIFGGYDKGRAIGPGTTYGKDPPQLLDIVIGVETGGSPFNFSSKTGLLLDSKGAHKSVAAMPDPITPYMHLSKQTCDGLAELLPITFDSSIGYYLWNQDDPSYESTVSTPAYLGFVFPPAPGNSVNVMIKVPMTLLNLTLTQPVLSSGSKQYFPCRAYDAGDNSYVLGRAFLQAAFIGTNWRQGVNWLAQAPGPGPSNLGLGFDPRDIQDGDTTLDYYNNDNLFAQSWSGHWTPLNGTTSPPSSGSPPSSSPSPYPAPASGGLSTGAKAGIGVGAGVGALLIAAILGALIWRRQKNSRDLHRASQLPYPVDAKHASPNLDAASSSGYNEYGSYNGTVSDHWKKTTQPPPGFAPHQLQHPAEMPDTRDPQELEGSSHLK
ncbi:hypothetical protein K461DRAFT_291185 [Myriangium duriaei CBS 260.36]|uniref:Peptidase A1 domain-containing protein n=1 Tax=Myriangium duriaei CBS 260.36 TaxID=1168546 RepID=A0A9P4J6F2_9PEZI|nr:hypothetical protein K461DRAFT_291185 [Myriangium duriaei CBS 260.36]